MLVNYNKEFLFIHIPKNAGSAIRTSLQHGSGVKLKEFDTHVPCTTLKSFFPDKFDKYYKFAFVRNPWDRLYSMYKFTVRRGWCPSNVPFKEWIHKDAITEACKFHVPIVPIQQKSQLDWITDLNSNIMVDFIGRFENIEEDFKKICKKIDMNYSLSKVNASPGSHYRDAYDDKSKKFVEKYYEKDIEVFKYVF